MLVLLQICQLPLQGALFYSSRVLTPSCPALSVAAQARARQLSGPFSMYRVNAGVDGRGKEPREGEQGEVTALGQTGERAGGLDQVSASGNAQEEHVDLGRKLEGRIKKTRLAIEYKRDKGEWVDNSSEGSSSDDWEEGGALDRKAGRRGGHTSRESV